MSQEIVLQPGESVTITAAPPPDPEPEPPADWDRIVPAGSHGDFTFAIDGERVMFEPGAIVKGTIRLARRTSCVRGFPRRQRGEPMRRRCILPRARRASSRTSTSSTSARPPTASATARSAPTTATPEPAGRVRGRSAASSRTRGVYGWYGTEVWGIAGLVVEDGTFKGKGSR